MSILQLPLKPWQNPRVQPFIQMIGICKSYEKKKTIENLNLSIYANEFFSLIGTSGCGKTTLLRMLSGLEKPSAGRILIDGVDITELPPYERPINMMFQSYALFPHMNVFDNVAFGLRQEQIPPTQIKSRVHEMLELVHMKSFQNRFPHQLSGGQCQRVALARALVKKPKVLLLDEPLAALDRVLREQTQFELVNLQERLGIIFIMVTHDQEEAMTLSTRIALLNEGRILQIGSPSEIYEYPNCRYVAEFVGHMNLFKGVVVDQTEEHSVVHCPELEQHLLVDYTAEAPVGSNVTVTIRPEKVMLSKGQPSHPMATNGGRGIVKDIAYFGDVSVYHIALPSGKMVLAKEANFVRLAERPITWEDEVFLFWRAENSGILVS